MTVLRIVPNVAALDLEGARAFYADVLGLAVVMDLGWIVTFASEARAPPQVSVALEGGSGAPLPDLTVEVDDLEAVLARAVARALPVVYGPVDEPWGVRRFFLRDPYGRLVNVLGHR